MPQTFSVISPIDGKVYVERAYASQTDIAEVLRSSRDAQLLWQAVPVAQRAKICLGLVDALLAKQEHISEELSWQMGRPIRYGVSELNGFAERARYMISVAENSLLDNNFTDQKGSLRFIRRIPVGVVLAMVPWNYPYLTAVNVLIPALMAGNSVMLKPSSQTPLTAEKLVDAANSAGLPPGLFQYCYLDHDAANKILTASEINYVSFTGSTAAGRNVEKCIAGRFIDAGLELGGKDPAYVRADADLTASVESLVDGAYFNSGQSCCGIERIYVHKDVYQKFVDQFVSLVEQYQLGNPLQPQTTLGPMVRSKAVALANNQIEDAVSKGATLAIDTAKFKAASLGPAYCAPQVLLDVDHSMLLMQAESFAPIVGIMQVNTDEQAITLMNDTEFGLTASVWTQDSDVAIRIGEQVQCGTWFMNRCDYLDPALAWTGMKNSGKGCSLSEIGYEKLTRPRSFHLTNL